MPTAKREHVPPPTLNLSRPKKGKGSALLIRVTQPMRDALDQEAANTGRSLSAAAERWLEEARAGHSDLIGRAGSVHAAAALERLAAIAREVKDKAGDPIADEYANFALWHAWSAALPHVLPLARPSTEYQAKAVAFRNVQKAARALSDALSNLDDGDSLVAAAFPALTSKEQRDRFERLRSEPNMPAEMPGAFLQRLENEPLALKNIEHTLSELRRHGACKLEEFSEMTEAVAKFEVAKKLHDEKVEQTKAVGLEIADPFIASGPTAAERR